MESDEKIKNNEKNSHNLDGKTIIKDSKGKEFIKEIHQFLAHPGARTTYCSLKNYYHIRKLKDICYEVCTKCEICKKIKNPKIKYGYIKGHLSENNDRRTLAIDILGPLKSNNFDFKKIKSEEFNILVMVDLYSRFTKVSIIQNIKTITVIKEIRKEWLNKVRMI